MPVTSWNNRLIHYCKIKFFTIRRPGKFTIHSVEFFLVSVTLMDQRSQTQI